MQVQDVMARSLRTCTAKNNLAEAASLMSKGGCGALPVLDNEGRVAGIITDRDVCICVGSRDRKASEITVVEAMSTDVAICHPQDEIHIPLKTMRMRKVRRLPVVTSDGKLVGMLSVSELLLHARHDDGSRPPLSEENVMSTLRGIYVHCPPHRECA